MEIGKVGNFSETNEHFHSEIFQVFFPVWKSPLGTLSMAVPIGPTVVPLTPHVNSIV